MNIELYLLRHADAGDPEAWHGDDALRPLSEKGERQAAALGRFLAAADFSADVILSSPRIRALRTAELVAAALGMTVEIDERLQRAPDVEELSAIAEGTGAKRIVFVGHDPDFSEAASSMTGAPKLSLKKGALARIDVSLPLRAGRGTLRWLLPPELFR